MSNQNQFEELLKGQEYLGTMKDMKGAGSQKTMLMIFIVDISGSMSGDHRIDRVNQAFREMIPELQRIQMEVNDAFSLSIAVIVFGSKARERVAPTPILEYVHTDIAADGGGTDYTNALETLKEKLSRKAYIAGEGKVAEPYLMLMTDGYPNDKGYTRVIEELENNLWYAHSQRYAVLIGADATRDARARTAVEAFVKDPEEGIVNAEEAKDIVKAVSAKTIHTIREMTMRKPRMADAEGEETKKGASPEKDTKNPYGENWEFDDPAAIYGKEFVF